MYKAFIEPDLKTAHIKITNKFNPFTGFQNPTYILKVCDNFFFLSGLSFTQFVCFKLQIFMPAISLVIFPFTAVK